MLTLKTTADTIAKKKMLGILVGGTCGERFIFNDYLYSILFDNLQLKFLIIFD